MRTLTLAAVLLSCRFDVALPQTHFLENGNPTLTGPDAGLFIDTPFRKKIDLAGEWKYKTDGMEWSSVLVPSSYDLPGKVVFQRTVAVTSEMLDAFAFTLIAYGVNYQCEVMVNGTFIGRHVGGYSSFVLPVPENILQVGAENVITVSCSNELTTRTTIPVIQQVGGWRTYGGIVRDMYLLATPKMFISDTDVRIEYVRDRGFAKVHIRSDIENRGYKSTVGASSADRLSFAVEIYDKLSNTLAAKSLPVPFAADPNTSTEVGTDVVLANPKMWSPASPDLYVLKCSIFSVEGKKSTPVDEFDLNLGVKDVQLKGSAILLNGEPFQLKGVVWREDHPLFGSSITYEALEKDFVQIKSLGANLVRFLYPPHPYALNLCDRYGLLAMEEVPLADVPPEIMSGEQYIELAKTYVGEMVLRDRSHVSVFAWGLGDDFDSGNADERTCDEMVSMKERVASLDGRPAYVATGRRGNACVSRFDVVAVSTLTDDAKEYRQGLQLWKKQYPDRPIIVVRYGKDVEPGNHNGYSDPLSMESQARYAMQHLEVAKELNVAGSVWWTFNDWRGDRPALSTHSGDPYVHSWGLVGYERDRRTAYDVVRAVFHGEKVSALPIGSYSSSAPIIYVVAGLVVLVAFAFLYNSNRRFRENVNRAMTRTYNFFADVRDQRILTYPHSLFLASVIAITWAIILSSILTHYRESVVLDNLLSQGMSDHVKEWFVRLVWKPSTFIVTVSGILLTSFVGLTVVVKACSFLARARITMYHSVAVVVWSMLPFVVLIPLAMILYRMMETPFYVVPSFLLLLILLAWVVMRLFKALSVIYDVYAVKVYVVGIILLVGAIALLYGYLDYTHSTSLYLKHVFEGGGTPPISERTAM